MQIQTNNFQMSMSAKNEFLKNLILNSNYFGRSKKEKGLILDQYCKHTHQNRDYVISKLRNPKFLNPDQFVKKRRRSRIYGDEITGYLVDLWEIFDHPCGQRLKSILDDQVDNLRACKELICSDNIAFQLKKISARLIDDKLASARNRIILKDKYFTQKEKNPLLHQIRVKTSFDQKRTIPGKMQLDCVANCGASASGQFIQTLNTTDLFSGWIVLRAISRKSQYLVVNELLNLKKNLPFKLTGIHSDNGTEFINKSLFIFSQNNSIEFTRSRPYMKNDNFLVEQKNWTHVRKLVGYLRYDTEQELNILNKLYYYSCLYKNYFQPNFKLLSKTRIGGHIKRKYGKIITPYQRLIKSKYLSATFKQQLTEQYQLLNPVDLKRNIDTLRHQLVQAYDAKSKQTVSQQNIPTKKLKPSLNSVIKNISLSFLNCTTK